MRRVEISLYGWLKSNASNAYTFLSFKEHIISLTGFSFYIFQVTFRNSDSCCFQLSKHAIDFDITLLITISLIAKDRLFDNITCNSRNLLTVLGTIKLVGFIYLTQSLSLGFFQNGKDLRLCKFSIFCYSHRHEFFTIFSVL